MRTYGAIFVILISAGSTFAQSVAATQENENSRLVVSVSDNSSRSELNAQGLIDAINSGDETIGALFGGPEFAFQTFPSFVDGRNIQEEDLVPEFRASVRSTMHYVTISYPSQIDFRMVVERLRRDDRFAYVAEPATGGFSVTPNDPRFLPSGFGPHPPYNTAYQWGLQTTQLNLPPAWDKNKGWAHVGIIDGGVPAISAPSLNPPYMIDHLDLVNVISKNHSWRFYG